MLKNSTCLHAYIEKLVVIGEKKICIIAFNFTENKMLPNKSSATNTKKIMFPDKKTTTKQMKTSTLTNAAGLNSLITFTVLLLAWIAGFASRLFAVIRFESIIHEFDPWYVIFFFYIYFLYIMC